MANENRGWLRVGQCAEAMGVSPQAFEKSYRGLLPADATKGKGTATRIHFRSLIDALIAREVSKVREALGAGDDALVYGGGDSPNLERLRAAKAKLAEMDLEERKGTHADLGKLDSALKRYGITLNRTGEVLQRKFGTEVADIFNEALEQAQAEALRAVA
jgi:hypothetical protein